MKPFFGPEEAAAAVASGVVGVGRPGSTASPSSRLRSPPRSAPGHGIAAVVVHGRSASRARRRRYRPGDEVDRAVALVHRHRPRCATSAGVPGLRGCRDLDRQPHARDDPSRDDHRHPRRHPGRTRAACRPMSRPCRRCAIRAGSPWSRTPPARSAAGIGTEPIGAHSDLVVFSFHPRKVITTGEGGMIMTGRDDWAQRLRRLREHGMS